VKKFENWLTSNGVTAVSFMASFFGMKCIYLLLAIVNVAQKRLQRRIFVTHSTHKHDGFYWSHIITGLVNVLIINDV